MTTAEVATLTVTQIAAQHQIHPNTVYRAARLGFLKGRRVGRLWRFPVNEVDRWMADGGRSR